MRPPSSSTSTGEPGRGRSTFIVLIIFFSWNLRASS